MSNEQILREVNVISMKEHKGGGKRHEKMGAHHHTRPFHGIRVPKGILLPPLFIPSILLLLKEEPSHGYSLQKKLSDVGVVDAEMDPSPIYKVLRMLEEQDLAVSEYDSGGRGPARKVYSLTGKGDETLDFMAERIEKATEIIAWFQDRYQELQ
jgi:PadR family transcriptional regulator PadR